MTKTTDDVVEQALDGLEDIKPKETEQVVEDPKDPSKEADTPEKGKETDEGYTADELEEEPKEVEPARPEPRATELDTSGLSAEDKYIVARLPNIVARVKDGDKVREISVKSWTQLPDDLEFATKRDELAFVNALQAQENRAVALQSEYRQSVQQQQNTEFQERENTAIREDIARLQKAGELPKFKKDPNDAEFSKDPAVTQIQEILDFMENRNKQYLAEYNQGRPFKHLGFEEAYSLYQRANPKTTAQAKEDVERKEAANKVGGSKGLSISEIKKPSVKPGTRIDQMIERWENEF